jgi:manganese transport protein
MLSSAYHHHHHQHPSHHTHTHTHTHQTHREAILYSSLDTVIALGLALFVNAAILVVAAAAFYDPEGEYVSEHAQASFPPLI